ncbi:MAG: helix-turn-helix domain-containing protein [Eubacteriales bacterium]|nr:helix-turn-helix domain-containing protein [Eubacteriales bacterium]
MIQAVIVEDEMLVRLGTKLCLEGYQGAIQVKEAFESGEEALQYFQNHTADVLITDIKLAGMSGLELIRAVKPEHLQMRTVVLSCYEDFAYAREAMELGVDKYLLKHELTGDELPKAVTELCREIRFVRDRNTGIRKSGQSAEEPAEEQNYALGYLVLRGEREMQNSGPEQIDLNILAEIIQKLLNVGKFGECFLRHGKEIFLVFQTEQETSEEEFSARIRNFYERLSRNIFNYFNRNTYLFVSDPFPNMGQITEKFSEMKQVSAYAFYYENSRLFRGDPCAGRQGTCPKLKLETEGAFTEKWFADCEKQARDFFFEARKNLADVAQVKAEVVKYYYNLEEYLANGTKEGGLAENYTSIDAFDSAEMLEEWLVALFAEIRRNLPGPNEQMQKIKEYIGQHYQEDLSLERIAAAFHMSMSYFSQYFKKQEGVNFVTYLNRLRIQKAKELLRDQEMTAEQAAEAIGISNPNYFVRLFKKMTGQTVGAYRKSLKS